MNLYGEFSFTHFTLALFALLVPLVSAHAQVNKSEAPATYAQKQETRSDSKEDEKAGEMESLRSQVKQLQSLLEQQQRALETIQKRLDETDGKTRAAVPVSSPRPDGTAGISADLRTAVLEVNQAPRNAPAASQSKPQDKTGPVVGWKDHAFVRSADGAPMASAIT